MHAAAAAAEPLCMTGGRESKMIALQPWISHGRLVARRPSKLGLKTRSQYTLTSGGVDMQPKIQWSGVLLMSALYARSAHS